VSIIPTEIDSNITENEALAQNALCIAPSEILDKMMVLEVIYYGFDMHVHQGQIVIHKEIISDVKSFFELAFKIKFPIEKVIPICTYQWDDVKSCDDNNSSGYNYRKVHGTNKLSKHSLGLAFDINPVQNIYIKYDNSCREIFRAPANGIYSKHAIGTLTDDHILVQHMRNIGWIWGGDWTPITGRIDYQHFEKPMLL
jgi:hypothetical protein